jgi:hypothetical protein
MVHYLVGVKGMCLEGIGIAGAITNILMFIGTNIYPLYVPKVQEAMRYPNLMAI